MKNIMCSRCKKNIAVVFMTRMENGKTINEGLCMKCAKELGIPQINDIIDKMGISEEELDLMNNQLMEATEGMEDDDLDTADDFEVGGARAMPFMQNFLQDAQMNADGIAGQSTEKVKNDKKEETKEKKYKYLSNYCEDLTQKAKDGLIDRIIGREDEIYRVIQILNRRTKNNPCLIGEPGVGKTAIAEGIAQKLADGDIAPKLKDKRLYLLDLTALIAGTQFRGQFESRVKGLVSDIKKAGNVILFIDEVHNLVGAGDSEGSMNAANILKPALSRGEIQVIGATTFNEYRKYIEKDSALERRFQPVKVQEPSIEDAKKVLKGIKLYYEKYHNAKVSDEIVDKAVVLSERYITDRYLPDKAIDLLDEACSCAALRNKQLLDYDNLKREYQQLQEQEKSITQTTQEVDYEQLAQVRANSLRIKGKIDGMDATKLDIEVTEDDLAKVIELWTGIPASKIKESEIEKVAHLEETLKKKIIGQDEAVELVAAAVRRSRIQLSARRRPASFIFVGPTGVGKTELVKVLSQELFDTADPLIRLDMSEFMEKHTVSRMIGSPPGYVGYDEAGQLTEKVRRRPYSVVLFDEIEKAHPDVLNILLQILDEGRITDAQGRTVSFENTVIVMTSNAGSERRESTVGFNRQPQEVVKDRVMKSLREFLRPEFLGRVDEIVVFRALSKEDYQKIAGLMLDELKAPLKEKNIKFAYDDTALAVIAEKAYGKQSGARDLRRVIRKEVEDEICLLLVDQHENPPGIIKLVGENQQLSLKFA